MSQEEIVVPKGWEMKTLLDVTVSHDGKRVPLNKSQRSQIQGKYPYYGGCIYFASCFIYMLPFISIYSASNIQ